MRLTICSLVLITVCGQATADLPRRSGAQDESHPGIEIEYGSLDVGDGVRLRTILTRPEGAERPEAKVSGLAWDRDLIVVGAITDSTMM